VLFADAGSAKRAIAGTGRPLPPGDAAPDATGGHLDPADPASIPFLWHKGVQDFQKAGTSVPLLFRLATVEDVRDAAAPRRTRELWKLGGSGGGVSKRRGGGGRDARGGGGGGGGRGGGRWPRDGGDVGMRDGEGGGGEGGGEGRKKRPRGGKPRRGYREREDGDVEMGDGEDGGGGGRRVRSVVGDLRELLPGRHALGGAFSAANVYPALGGQAAAAPPPDERELVAYDDM